ncbi:MAG: PTS sugar transporter subunit IIA [Candidatus Eisenbacteria bacterium]|nr:PTS sugar transporter subunit IIA [Candidatus Eisenbacteria bacterium]
MKINELLDSHTILLNPKAKKKFDLIREMVSLLSDRDLLRSPKKVLADVIDREKEKGTGLEQGVAVPHCRSEGTEKPAAAFALAQDGIDFGALDGRPSRFVFLLVSPKNATTAHVQALATMVRILKQPEVQAALLRAKTPEEAAKALAEVKV